MKNVIWIFGCIGLSVLFGLSPAFAAQGNHQIKVLVGDTPITQFQIDQRINLHLMSNKGMVKDLRATFKSKRTQERWRNFIKQKKPQSKAEVSKLQKQFVARLQAEVKRRYKPKLRKVVLEELINERLMIKVAKKNNIIVTDATLEDQLSKIASRNSKDTSPEKAKKAFFAHLRSRGVGISTFKEKIRASMAWQQVIRRKFGGEVRFGDRDVERQFGLNDADKQSKKVQFNLQKIIITIASQKDQAAVVKQYIEADKIRARFRGCTNMRSMIAPFKNAKVVPLGNKTVDELPAPTNVIISDMKTGEITPPQPIAEGIEMYAVCGRKQVAQNNKERQKMLGEMRQKAFQLRAKRYLSDIRQDAHIEIRN